MGFFSRLGGLEKLVENYQTDRQPQSEEFKRQTIGLGAVKYRNCVTVHIEPEGLYLWVRPPFFSHPPILIPWAEIVQAEHTTLYHRSAVEVTVKAPGCKTITVYEDLFVLLKPHLPVLRVGQA
jgi:hypothetical protein